jgi:hypothetical protein
MSSEKHLLNKLKNRYLMLRMAETLLLAVGAWLSAFSLTSLVGSGYLALIAAVVVSIAVAAFQVYSLHLYHFSESRVAVYLNQHYPELEASTDLLLTTGTDLTTLQLIQKSQVFHKLQSIESDVKFPHRLLLALIVCVAGIALWFAVSTYFTGSSATNTKQTTQSNQSTPVDAQAPVIPKLSKLAINVNPPAYTQVRSVETTNPHLKVIEGSSVTWTFEFSGQPIEPTLVFSGKDSVLLKQKNESYQIQRTLAEGGFYQLTWKEESGKGYQTDYYPIEIIKDEGPHIEVQNPAQFVELKLTDRLIVDLQANLSDDFGLKDAHIIATVSKGSGESVKFREETLRFLKPQQFSGKNQSATRSIDIVKLGLEPGDELYFYIEAFDNKSPVGNKSRTETFFIALKDTATYEMAEDEGLGVDLMPEYFRSQRQIIIDSEKLLEEQKKKQIEKKDFNFKSNELGYDQKVLRLRYGQFMGEEADSGIGQQSISPADHEDDKDEDPMKKFGHMHDTENEHHLVAEKKADSHDHGGKEEDKENPMAAFTHNHDDVEEATFLIQSIKTKLRTALTLMWDAELHLRMYDPKTSLPYQYKILKLLKEISNDSRVYVHRSGFDPPPLKEEKRLSGDLSEIKTSFNQRKEDKEELYPGIRQALITIESLLQKENPQISAASQLILQKAGNELAGVAVQQPGAYLKSLSSLRSLIAYEVDKMKIKPTLKQVQQSFWKVLPRETISPSAKRVNTHPLDAQFLQQLEELKNER